MNTTHEPPSHTGELTPTQMRSCSTCTFKGTHFDDASPTCYTCSRNATSSDPFPCWVPINTAELTTRPTPKQPAGVKHDQDKIDLSLLPLEAVAEIAKVLDFGAKKYSRHNWRTGFPWTRVLAASLRHLWAWAGGQDKDPETGLSHLAHAGCNILFLITFELSQTGTDDRYKPGTEL
jgi:hypothetical protein